MDQLDIYLWPGTLSFVPCLLHPFHELDRDYCVCGTRSLIASCVECASVCVVIQQFYWTGAVVKWFAITCSAPFPASFCASAYRVFAFTCWRRSLEPAALTQVFHHCLLFLLSCCSLPVILRRRTDYYHKQCNKEFTEITQHLNCEWMCCDLNNCCCCCVLQSCKRTFDYTSGRGLLQKAKLPVIIISRALSPTKPD